MADTQDLSEQLTLTQKLTAAIEQMAKSADKVEQSYATQIDAVQRLAKAMETLKGMDLGALNGLKLDGLQKEVKDTEKTVTSLSGRFKDLSLWMSKKLPISAGAAVGAMEGFLQGLRNIIGVGKAALGFFGGLAESVFSLTASIISIPLKIFSGLVDMAAKAGGMNELAQAIENLRKEFGALQGVTPKTIFSMTREMKGFAATGLNAWMVFGNFAERIQAFTKLAVEMGAVFTRLTKELQTNGGAVLAYQKALGISDEQMKGFGAKALATGASISEVLKDTAKYALELGKAFNLDSKIIGKDVAKALQDVKHFAGATVKEIAQASVYARKLGLELDKIVGTLDAFETFDSAAENAAKLSQAFGVQIDAFKLMEAQNPAEQMDMLRKSFLQAGKSAENMSRQELKLLAQTTGLDEATAKMAFSARNQGMSLDEVKKKGADAEKKTMTQAEAMSKLADNIERLVRMGTQTGSFWDMFIKGFLDGIQWTKEFMSIIMNIKQGLYAVYWEGRRLGQAFVQLFPGMQDFLGGIADFFKPGKFKKLAAGVVDEIIQFMKDLTDPNGKASFASLMDKIQKKFFDFFNSEEPAGKKLLEGFKTVFKTIARIAGEGIKWVSDKVGEAIHFVIDLITGKRSLSSLGGAAGGALGFMMEVLEPLIDGLKHAWKVLAPAVWELIKTLGKKLYEFLTSDEFIGFIKPAMPYVAAALFGPAFVRALVGAGTTAIAKSALQMLSGPGKKALESVSGKAVENVAGVTKASGSAIQGAKGWGVKDAASLGLKLVAIAAALAIGGVMMATSLIAMKAILKSGGINKPEDAITPLAVLGAMTVAAIPLMLALKLAKSVGDPVNIAVGGAMVALAVGIVGGVGALLTLALKKVGSPAQLTSAADFMLKMCLVFLAMVPLIAGAMAIGSVVTASSGVALAVIAAGMATISATVASMVLVALEIVKQLAKLAIGPDFQTKIDAFLSIMSAIQKFADTLVKIIDLMTPSFMEFITGTATTFSQKADSATALLKNMIGEKGKGNGIIGLIEFVIDTLKGISTGPEIEKAAGVFGPMLSATTGLLQALTPSEAFFNAGDSFLARMSDGSKSMDHMNTNAASFANNLKAALMRLLTGEDGEAGKGGLLGVMSALSTIKNFPKKEQVDVVAGLMTAVAGIMTALTPSPELIKAFQSTATTGEGNALLKTSQSFEKFDGAGMAQAMKVMLTAMKELLPTIAGPLVKSMIAAAEGLDPKQLEKIKVVGDALKVVVDLARMVNDGIKAAGGQLGNTDAMVAGISSMAVFLFRIAKGGGAFGTATSPLQSMFDSLGDVAQIVVNGNVGSALIAVKKMVAVVNQLNDALSGGTTNKIDIATKLGTLASSLGLGSKGSYEIKNKDINITVNLQVTMDVGEVEKVMVLRNTSVIRDRLNYLTEDHKGVSKLPDTATGVVQPLGSSTK